MNRTISLLTCFLSTIFILIPFNMAQADDDYIEAKRLLEAGEILPLEAILKKVRQVQAGKILEVELEKEHGHIVYEVEILTDKGMVKEIFIDAKTGQLISAKEDD